MLPTEKAFLAALPSDLSIDLDLEALLNASGDVFSLSAYRPFAILVPTKVEQVQQIWMLGEKYSIALINRGAGLSYTHGVVPSMPGMAVLDLTKMDSIGIPQQLDRFISVESGATWKAMLWRTLDYV